MSFKMTATRGQRVSLGYIDFPASTGACSITLWVSFSAFTIDGQRIVCKATNSTYYWVIDVLLVSSVQRFRARLRTGTTTYTATATSHVVATGTKYFVCMRYDGSNLKLYCDNVEIATVACTGNIAVDSAVMAYLGDNPQNTVRTLNGTIDDVRVYTKALTANEQLTIFYGAGNDGLIDSLLWRWPLNYGPVTGITRGANSLIDVGPLKINAHPESSGTCLDFDRASSQRVTLANVNSDFQLVAPFSVMAWIKVDNYPDWAYPVAYTVGQIVAYDGDFWECIQAHTSQSSWQPDVATSLWRWSQCCVFSTRNGNNGIWFGLVGASICLMYYGSGERIWYSSTVITRNTWQNIAVIFTDVLTTKYITFFLNGSQTAQETQVLGANPGTTLSTAQIGSKGTEDYFDGRIGEIMVFKNLDATASNVARWMYEEPIPANTSIVGQWQMNEESGTTIADSTGKGHTGTSSNANMIVDDNPITAPTYREPLST